MLLERRLREHYGGGMSDEFSLTDLRPELAASFDEECAMLSEGFCPRHRQPVDEAGWCAPCGEYWSLIRDGRIITHSPSPTYALEKEPGLQGVRDAVRRARGGDAPAQVTGFA